MRLWAHRHRAPRLAPAAGRRARVQRRRARAGAAVPGLAVERRVGRLQFRALDERMLADRWHGPAIDIAVRADPGPRSPIQHASRTLSRWPWRSRVGSDLP